MYLPTSIGPFVKTRPKLGGDDMEPVVRAPINQHIVPLLVTHSRLRNLAEKLGLEVFKTSWVFAGFCTVSVDCMTNYVATLLCL